MPEPKLHEPAPLPIEHRIAVADLDTEGETAFRIEADEAALGRLARHLDVDAVEGVVFAGTLAPSGNTGWRLDGRITGTLRQTCVVTLDPIETALDRRVVRRFEPGAASASVVAFTLEGTGDPDEAEDDGPDPLGDEIDLGLILVEELALSVDPYPRKPGAEHGQSLHAAPGVAPLDDAAMKPFAGLAELRKKMADEGK